MAAYVFGGTEPPRQRAALTDMIEITNMIEAGRTATITIDA